ncbi:aminotransferase [Nocardioides baekrokdamisoli]|uniref:Aminotransferase n=1 Tax=Nocardioides baekrokdamisoli TaxID=1804624 RepID=A0A3G9J0V9_9ACTN|nr:aminotransferase class I/II-fold pyridoxal phosphate-dependent enzyme [Nocardioides baekrokdamisoli]BBH17268.1 aminotransferase [Nocardioides baekrokdamisoli]
MTLSQRLHGIPPTIFTEISALAVRTGAVNLGQGFPDEDGPATVLEAAARAMRDGANQYPPGPGIPVLREALARHQQRTYGLELDPFSQVVVTTGATEAIAAAILGLINPGDEVLVLEPYYDSYAATIQMAGGVRRTVPLRAPDFRLDPQEFAAAVTPRTKAILLNTPHNPTGTVLSADELRAIRDLAVAHDLIVISDEVYEHLTYETPHTPIATLPGMAERTLTISSLGKSYSLTGWKVGWATGPQHLVAATLSAKQWLTFTTASPLQHAAAYALDSEPTWPDHLRDELHEKRDRLVSGLNGLGIPTTTPQGTYFAVSDVRTLGWSDGDAFARTLPDRAGVACIPLKGFHDSDAGATLVRWAFCKKYDVVDGALERLARADLSAV